MAHKIEDAAHRLEGYEDGGAASRSRRRRRRQKGKKEPLLTREGGDNVPLEVRARSLSLSVPPSRRPALMSFDVQLILLLSGWVAALQRRKTIDVRPLSPPSSLVPARSP